MMNIRRMLAVGTASLLLITVPLTACAANTETNNNSATENEPPAAPPDGGNGKPDGEPPSGGQPGGQSQSSVTYNYLKEINSDTTESDKTYSTTTSDEIALGATGGTVTENNLTVEKSGDSNGGDNCNFYGQNAAVLAKDGATLNINGGTITSDANGANGVFSYGGNGANNGASGDGTTVNIKNTKITTTGSGSGGIMTAGGGVTNATNLTVNTSGQSSAAIRSDRGGGTVTVDGGTYTTTGKGSPAVYSTADITIKNAKLTSKTSEGVVIEGLNSVKLSDTSISANNTTKNGNATHYDGIFLYQSMSGDAATGTSTFDMNGGTITNENGEVFHVTSTDANINLTGVSITNNDSENVLLDISNDGWSSNGNNATVTATNQTLTGNIIVDNAKTDAASAKSTLKLTMKSSSYKGAINSTVSDKGTVDVTLDNNSIWELTGDSYVTSISGSGSINYNGHTLYIDGKAYTAENPYSEINSTTENATDESSTSETTDTTKTTKKSVVFKNTTKTYKKATLKKSSKSYSIIKSSDGGQVTVTKYSSKAKKYITVSKAGKVTVKKGTPKGTYKVTVKVAAKGNYKTAKKTIKVIVK